MNTTASFLSKDSQKALREKYTESLNQIWYSTRTKDVDQKMVDFCQKDTMVIVPMDNGTIVAIPKPRIEKDFCFGYSDHGQGMTYDECNETLDAVRSDLATYFKEENLRKFDSGYSRMVNKEYPSNLCLTRPYHSQDDANLLRRVNVIEDNWGHTEKEYDPITSDDIARYKEAIAWCREKFSKQLDTYLKKYGTKKLKTWRYWADA